MKGDSVFPSRRKESEIILRVRSKLSFERLSLLGKAQGLEKPALLKAQEPEMAWCIQVTRGQLSIARVKIGDRKGTPVATEICGDQVTVCSLCGLAEEWTDCLLLMLSSSLRDSSKFYSWLSRLSKYIQQGKLNALPQKEKMEFNVTQLVLIVSHRSQQNNSEVQSACQIFFP